jgi:hypothetical protein
MELYERESDNPLSRNFHSLHPRAYDPYRFLLATPNDVGLRIWSAEEEERTSRGTA